MVLPGISQPFQSVGQESYVRYDDLNADSPEYAPGDVSAHLTIVISLFGTNLALFDPRLVVAPLVIVCKLGERSWLQVRARQLLQRRGEGSMVGERGWLCGVLSPGSLTRHYLGRRPRLTSR